MPFIISSRGTTRHTGVASVGPTCEAVEDASATVAAPTATWVGAFVCSCQMRRRHTCHAPCVRAQSWVVVWVGVTEAGPAAVRRALRSRQRAWPCPIHTHHDNHGLVAPAVLGAKLVAGLDSGHGEPASCLLAACVQRTSGPIPHAPGSATAVCHGCAPCPRGAAWRRAHACCPANTRT